MARGTPPGAPHDGNVLLEHDRSAPVSPAIRDRSRKDIRAVRSRAHGGFSSPSDHPLRTRYIPTEATGNTQSSLSLNAGLAQ